MVYLGGGKDYKPVIDEAAQRGNTGFSLTPARGLSSAA